MSPSAHLRAWHPADVDALRDALADDPDLARQFPSEGDAAALLALALTDTDDRRVWAIALDGRAVGAVTLSAIEHRHDTAWASYWLAPEARGRGLAAGALAGAAEWAFGEGGLFRIELGHRVNNPASCRVATLAGFPAEGVERGKLRYGAERFDVETHARLADDPAPAVAPLPREVSRRPPAP